MEETGTSARDLVWSDLCKKNLSRTQRKRTGSQTLIFGSFIFEPCRLWDPSSQHGAEVLVFVCYFGSGYAYVVRGSDGPN
jgi:hypothetical protein